MAFTAREAREQILDDLAVATDQVAVALACLGEAYEQLSVDAADRLEDELFRPLQRAYARAKRTHAGFAKRSDLPEREFATPAPGVASQGVKLFVERAVDASEAADRKLAELQDSMLPIEAGDPDLRAALGEIRGLLAPVPGAARAFLRVLGR